MIVSQAAVEREHVIAGKEQSGCFANIESSYSDALLTSPYLRVGFQIKGNKKLPVICKWKRCRLQ